MRRPVLLVLCMAGALAAGLGFLAAGGSARPTRQGVIGSWRIVERSAKEQLSAIHALSSGAVWIAGKVVTGKSESAALVEYWDGRRLQQLPTAAGATAFSDVAPVSRQDVWAIGESKAVMPVIEHWNGSVWQNVEFQHPATPTCGDPSSCDLSDFTLNRVSAVGPHDVWALGYISACDINDCAANLYAEHWDGSTWTSVPVSAQAPPEYAEVTDMEALSPTDIWAVGYDHEGPGTQNEFILRWNGRRWLGARSVLPGVDCGETWLFGVATPKPNDVWAVGGGDHCPWGIEHWNGTGIRLVRMSGLWSGVDASSPSNVWVVGGRAVERWNGNRWAEISTSQLGRNIDLKDVAALGAGNVWAIGNPTLPNGNLAAAVVARYTAK